MTDDRLRQEIVTAAKALDLSAPAIGLGDVEITSGLYSLAARSVEAIDALRLEDRQGHRPLVERVLYVGKAQSSLFTRLAETHFVEHKTGRSTVRRTLAALLGLAPVPRATRIANPTRAQLMTLSANYALEPGDEVELTRWMRSQLEIRCFPSTWMPLKDLERPVAAALKPPLDQERPPMWGPNPWYEEVGTARERMRLRVRRGVGIST
jgi:hypothetical protein